MRVISKANHLRDNIEHMLFDMDQEVRERRISASKKREVLTADFLFEVLTADFLSFFFSYVGF